jgi:cell division protease FtsH
MMIRNLVRKICVRHKDVQVSAINGWVDEEILGTFMAQAEASRPAILILEELDSLAAQHRLTRASLLTTLDGLQPHEGLMVLATTNNPGEVDPALLHRPSRFDRVWRFDLPDGNLRRRYLGDKFRECSGEVLDKLARRTEGWTFAYLNELRVTAGVIAIRDQDGQYTDAVLLQAHQLLEAQYEAGRRSHALPDSHGQMGFRSE